MTADNSSTSSPKHTPTMQDYLTRNPWYLQGPSPYWSTLDNHTVRLYLGHVLDRLRDIPDRCVQCVVTSPPYWGLRDYQTGQWQGGDEKCDHKRPNARMPNEPGSNRESVCGRCGARRVDQQLGSEPTPGEYVANMVAVFREIKRVLRDDGTAWLNLASTYQSGKGEAGGPGARAEGRNLDEKYGSGRSVGLRPNDRVIPGLPGGSLVAIPWMVAFALQADGWVLRQDILWAKRGPMPESVQNRCTKSHEYVFLLTKSMDYYFDQEAIKEPAVCDGTVRKPEKRKREKSEASVTNNFNTRIGFSTHDLHINGRNKRDVWEADDHRALLDWLAVNDPELLTRFLEESNYKTDTWWVNTKSYSGAHYAVFPPSLISPMILAGTSEKGACVKCGAPWVRVTEKQGKKHYTEEGYYKSKKYTFCAGGEVLGRRNGSGFTHDVITTTIGWNPTCKCTDSEFKPLPTRPCIVLDPFIGSGTTAEVCLTLKPHRWCWGIDLSRKYLDNNAIPRVVKALGKKPSLHHLIP